MFGYMTDLSTVEESKTEEITAQGSQTLASKLPVVMHSSHPARTHTLIGDDLESLLFHFLDEFLFTFSADPFFIPKVYTCCVIDDHNVTMLCYYTESKNN